MYVLLAETEGGEMEREREGGEQKLMYFTILLDAVRARSFQTEYIFIGLTMLPLHRAR